MMGGNRRVARRTARRTSRRVNRRQNAMYGQPEPANDDYDDYEEAPAPAQADYTEELAKLGELKAQGVLTEEEFQAKKKQILGL
jgi:hypothetical protein